MGKNNKGLKNHTHNHSIQVWYLANVILVKNMFFSKIEIKGITNPGIKPLTISGSTWASVYSAAQITSPMFSVVMPLLPPLHHAQPFPIRELVPNPKLPTTSSRSQRLPGLETPIPH